MTARVMILGSRIYQPLTDIDAAIRELPPDATVTACGASPVCVRANLAATSLGLESRHVTLSPDRREVLQPARAGASVWLFQAVDPATKQITEGIAQIEAFLRAQGIVPRVFRSRLPGKSCDAITRVLEAAERVRDAKQEGRRRVATVRALKTATVAAAMRDEYERRLTEGMPIGVGDEAFDGKWLTWLAAYERLSDALGDVELVLGERLAA